MDHISLVHIVQSHADLHHPLENLLLSESLILLLLLVDMECHVANCKTSVLDI